jgi:hypothetical protein
MLNVLPPYSGPNGISSLSTGTGPNLGLSLDNHQSSPGTVYPLFKGGCGTCGCKFGGKSKGRKWSRKYKRSINCRRPKGFSQRQYCKYGRGRKTARRS